MVHPSFVLTAQSCASHFRHCQWNLPLRQTHPNHFPDQGQIAEAVDEPELAEPETVVLMEVVGLP
jgi:hypothetical protein